MESKNKPLEDIDAIRTIMERSTRFLSLSGLSGIIAGIIGLAGGLAAIFLILDGNTDGTFPDLGSGHAIRESLIIDSLIMVVLAIIIALVLSYRKAIRLGTRLWTPVSKRLMIHLLIPLITGAFFIIILYNNELYSLIIPSMLIFYGLALVNAGKFTFGEIFYLGLLQVILGLVAALLPYYGIFLWLFGFGILHVAYGVVMYRKYDR